jgi:Ca2+-binding RTX toxin-like protein
VVATDDSGAGNAASASETVTITIAGTGGPVAAPTIYTGPDADANDFDNIDTAPASSPVTFSGTGSTADTVHGSNSADTISGNNGVDTIYGNGGDDILSGGNAADLIYGGSGADSISGGNQTDTLYGGSGADGIAGNEQNDNIYGGSGADTINGNAGADMIAGGYGADLLTGGIDADTFVFLNTRDTGDTITDYTVADDTISLTGIDANANLVGNQNFGSATNSDTLTANGVIWFYDSNLDKTIIQADTDGDVSTAEFQIQLNGNIGLTSGEFLL